MSFFLHALTRQGTACKSSRGGRYSLLPSQTSEAVRASTAEGPVSRCRSLPPPSRSVGSPPLPSVPRPGANHCPTSPEYVQPAASARDP